VHAPVEVARLQLRRGWRGLVGIAVLVALVGGLLPGAAAGARRTATAVDRMIVSTETADVTRVVTVVTVACVAGVLPSLAGLRHRPADVLRAK
jgi:hypothetical protein